MTRDEPVQITADSQFMCGCADGFIGSRCEIDIARADCMQQPCLNGGTCVTAVATYSCLCQQYYEVQYF